MFDYIRFLVLVLELKRTESTPEAIGKLNFEVAVVNDTLRQPQQLDIAMAAASYRYTELQAIDQVALPR